MLQEVKKYKVFTDDFNQGNAATVVAYRGWHDAEMLEIARDSGTPVTVFVQFSNEQAENTVLRYFSSEKEMAFCGHGTLAAGAFILQQYERNPIQVVSGSGTPIVISKSPQGHFYFKTSRVSRLDMKPDKIEVAYMLGVNPEIILDDIPFCVASIGSPKLFVPLRHLTALDEVIPNFEQIRAWSEKYGVNGVYVYTFQETVKRNQDDKAVYINARGFNPLFGIPEDAATGVAAGALGDLLFQAGGLSEYVIQQGKHVGAKSEISVKIKTGSVEIGGSVLNLI
ncbi:PhzF family phenazine biosynthesis protein [Paenibacillus amylolyticus]|uniref:PhzF family phenazine biosynthesis protein n=1 Tax=Paenibacillus amylolyticus TaxID=1451 RepID=UPI003EBC1813